jgi:hypothetical protein
MLLMRLERFVRVVGLEGHAVWLVAWWLGGKVFATSDALFVSYNFAS